MVHCLQSSYGDKVLNRSIVLARWDVTLMDVLNESFSLSLEENCMPHLVYIGDIVLLTLRDVGSERHKVNM